MRLKHYAGAQLPSGEYGRSDLNCDKCYRLKREDGVPPLCETGTCSIQDLASDPTLARMLYEFTTQRILFEMTNSEMVYNRLCEDFGFTEDLAFHYQCEAVYLEWRHKEKQKKKPGKT